MLNLRLSQNRQHVKCGQKTTLFALLEVAPDESTRIIQKRKHVALVIDCSGSMDGKKLDDAKNAAMGVVDSLDPRDLVSVVTFESDVDVKLRPTPASDGSIEDTVRSIRANGGTAMHGGMAAAFQLLKQESAPDIISRMEVFSDGEPNVAPYDDADFMRLTAEIRNGGITTDIFGIGDDYNGPLLMQIAESGRGKWEHVSDTDALTRLVTGQITEMENTVITNPQLQITLMPGSELVTMAITRPFLQEIGPESKRTSGNTTYVGLNDIIMDQVQTVAMRIAIPPISGSNVQFVTAAITEGSNEVAAQSAVIFCTDDKDLYNMEVDSSPRVILSSSEATVLFRRGLEGDPEATRMANTILKGLDDPDTTRIMDEDAQATVINAREIAGSVQPGMSESDKKRILHDTTVIGTGRADAQAEPAPAGQTADAPDPRCQSCGHAIRPASRVCGNCGKVINR